MKELMNEVQGLLEANPGGVLDSVMKNGKVLQIASREEFPDQNNTPAIAIIDGGFQATHLSSKVRQIDFTVNVVVFVRIFDQYKKIQGKPPTAISENKAASEIQKIIRGVLDYDRIGGKYAHAFLRSEESVGLVRQSSKNEFFLSMGSAWAYRKFES